MQADGFLARKDRHPFGMTMAIAINGAAVAALLLAKGPAIPDLPKVLETINIPIEPEPEPVPPPLPKETVTTPEQVTIVKPVVQPDSDRTAFTLPDLPKTNFGDADSGAVSGIDVTPPQPPLPVLKDAYPDPRFAADFQPPYPPGKQRLGEEGRAVVRVLIGTDGRVKRIERVSGTDEAFMLATERQALRRWRFKPATRDGRPVESWKTMTVRFEMTE